LKAEAERWAKECPQQNKGPVESAALAKVNPASVAPWLVKGVMMTPTKVLESKRVESEMP